MIARRWSGVVATERRDEYVTYVEATGVAEYRRTPGCLLASILTRDLDGSATDSDRGPRTEVVAFSVWESEAHVRAFAGEDIDQMVLYPEDEAFLLEAPTLTHFQVPMFALPSHQPS